MLCLSGSAYSSKPFYGATFSYALVASEPEHANAVQFMLKYDPQIFQWRQWDIYFDAGVSRVWTNQSAHNRSLNIYSVAPVFRYIFVQRGPTFPYLELSIGLSYLSRTRIDHRNLGMHFAFQDRIGLGTFIGVKKAFSLGLHAVHYSNASFCSHNSGLTLPLVVDLSYRFN